MSQDSLNQHQPGLSPEREREVWALGCNRAVLYQGYALCGRVPCREEALHVRELLHRDALWEEPSVQGSHRQEVYSLYVAGLWVLHVTEQAGFLKLKEK